MTWFWGGRKLRIEGGGCADITRISNYFAGRQINNVLSQVRIVDIKRAIGIASVDGVDACQTVDLIAHPPRPRGERGVTPTISSAASLFAMPSVRVPSSKTSQRIIFSDLYSNDQTCP